MDKKCETCEHWFPLNDGSNKGKCKREAPRPTGTGNREGFWPEIINTEMCNQWERQRRAK